MSSTAPIAYCGLVQIFMDFILSLSFIEVQFVITYCIDRIIGNEFMYPLKLWLSQKPWKLMPTNITETTVSFLHKSLHFPSLSITRQLIIKTNSIYLKKIKILIILPLFLRHTVDQCSELHGPTQNLDRSWPPVRLTDKQQYGRRVLGM